VAPTSTGAAQPTAGVSSGPPVAVAAKTPAVDRPYAAPPSAAQQFAASKALRAASLQSDGARLATSTPSVPDSSEPLNARDRPLPPDKNAPKGANGVAGVVLSSSHKLDSPAKLSRRLSPLSVVAETETATPSPEAKKAPEAPGEQAPPETPPAPAQQPANPLTHAFSYIVGALGPAAIKGANSEGQPVQLADYASLGNAPPSGNLAPTSVGAAQPTDGVSSGPPAAVDTSVGAAEVAAPAPAAPQFTDPKTKPSGRVVIAKIETPAPGPEAEKAAEAPPAPTQQPSHPFSNILGALGPANQTATHKTGDWAMQFATEKSEAEAKIKVARLNARYAAALNGATIGVQKTLVNGETIYALRVTGLSKADAAALCDRLKGRDCFIVR
jgi:SPOR domain